MTKTFEAKPGDRWTKYPPDTLMYLYRDGKCTFFRENRSGVTQSRRQASELDLPTPDALAQLREWGYVVTGDVAEVKPLEVNVCLITESRVREIVAEMLAAHPTPAEVREAAKGDHDFNGLKQAVAPEPDWKGLLEELEDSIVGVMNEGTFVPNVTLAKLNIVLVRLNAALAAARKAVGK